MNEVIFFKSKNYYINKLFPKINFKKNIIIKGVKPLYLAKKKRYNFFRLTKVSIRGNYN